MSEVAFGHGSPLWRALYIFLNAYPWSDRGCAGVAVLRLYLVYRALVRAKIARLHALQQAGAHLRCSPNTARI